jgi:hypothetical protein
MTALEVIVWSVIGLGAAGSTLVVVSLATRSFFAGFTVALIVLVVLGAVVAS